MIKNYLARICIIILAIIAITSFFNGCSKSGDSPGPNNNSSSLTITGLNVNAGPYTTQVLLTGTGFSTTAANNHVSFNGKAAVVQGATSTHLLTSVPLAAGTGTITVTVNGTTATGPVFTYQPQLVIATLAGDIDKFGFADGPGASALFTKPTAIAADAAGNLYIADNDLIRKVTPAGLVSTFAGSGKAGNADGTGSAASFNLPSAIAFDGAGNLYVADEGNFLIRKITPAGVVTTFAGNGDSRGRQIDGTGTAAGFAYLSGIAIDGAGNITVLDAGPNVIRKITPSGVVTTIQSPNFAEGYPGGIVLDKAGNMFVSEQNERGIVKIAPNGTISGFAGGGSTVGGDGDGTGNRATFFPGALTMDANGNLFVADPINRMIKEISPAAVVTTIAGNSVPKTVDGPIANALVYFPVGITVDASGNIYFIDASAVRKISVQ